MGKDKILFLVAVIMSLDKINDARESPPYPLYSTKTIFPLSISVIIFSFAAGVIMLS